MVMKIQALQPPDGMTLQQRLRTRVGERAERQVEHADPIEDWGLCDRDRDLIRAIAVAQPEVAQLWEATAVEDRRQVGDLEIAAVILGAQPELEMLQARELGRGDLAHDSRRKPTALDGERAELI